MWIKCNNCNEIRETSSKRAYEIKEDEDPKNIAIPRIKCGKCKHTEFSWVLNPKYKKKSIGILSIEKYVKQEYSENVPTDERTGLGKYPVISDFRIVKMTDEFGDKIFWLPYWITIKGKKRYGQYAQIIPEKEFIKLIEGAIRNGFLKDESIKKIKNAINDEGKEEEK